MGVRGPIPNRDDDLARDRARNGRNQGEATKGLSREASIPAADPTWHSIATLLWESALASGQADFYESSDYAMLYSLCDDLSYLKSMGSRSAVMLAAIYSAMTSLLLTEGDRRRVRIELENAEDTDAEVVDMSERRKRLGIVA